MSGTDPNAAVEPVVPAVTPTPEPVSVTPAETPAPQTAEPQPPVEVPATPETPAEKPAEGLLSKPPEAPQPEGQTQDQTAQPTEQVVERVTYEAPTLPEGVSLDTERLTKFDELVGTHKLPAEARQELIDMYIADRQASDQAALQRQIDTFAQTRKAWRDQVAADEHIGGAGMATSIANAMKMIDMFVAPADRAEFDKALEYTGMTDHPQMIKFLNNLHKKFGAPPTPVPPNNPPPDRGRQNGGQRRMRDMYDNPRSPGNRV